MILSILKNVRPLMNTGCLGLAYKNVRPLILVAWDWLDHDFGLLVSYVETEVIAGFMAQSSAKVKFLKTVPFLTS
jgi:hypothetical protein